MHNVEQGAGEGIDKQGQDLEKATIPQVDLDHNVVDGREDELDLLGV